MPLHTDNAQLKTDIFNNQMADSETHMEKGDRSGITGDDPLPEKSGDPAGEGDKGEEEEPPQGFQNGQNRV